MAVDFAVAIDLEGFIEEALVGGLVVVEGVGVLGPGAHFELDAEWGCTYNGGFMISFFMGFMNLFAFMSYYIINHRKAGRLTHGLQWESRTLAIAVTLVVMGLSGNSVLL